MMDDKGQNKKKFKSGILKGGSNEGIQDEMFINVNIYVF